MRVVRWIIVAVGILAILGGVMQLITPVPDATTVNQETGGNVTQEAINQNVNNQKLGSVALIVFWIFIIAITMYYERKSIKNGKESPMLQDSDKKDTSQKSKTTGSKDISSSNIDVNEKVELERGDRLNKKLEKNGSLNDLEKIELRNIAKKYDVALTDTVAEYLKIK